MAETGNEYELVLKAAWCYYMENYTQQQISQLMGISRGKVIRLLESARNEGVIHFIFRQEDQSRMVIERDLVGRFGLSDAFVIPTPARAADLTNSIASAASMYIANHLRADGFLNIGYGDMTGMILENLAVNRRSDINVASLTGGVSYYLPKVRSEVFSMHLYLTPSPLILSTPELRDALLHEPSVQDVYRMTLHADMTAVGIGSMSEDATIIRNGILSKTDFALLKMQGAVGDVLNHFIDADGNPVATDIERRVVSTDLEALQKMRNVVGVAGGSVKVPAISAVLRHHYLNVLVTDEVTATELLDYQPES
ncbi:sugar-binding transcriptional regulator [Olsenella sp. Marseille-P4559]|uniref:sugar-binding transcriptional regulator n=1 Tax=Olsenella sp. Marseille-P4559 TaxID=2364795 RepID=UPI0010316DEC|nr:sugar-binding domain-containing protein [Olsenella sp. Marseille-P4559]